MKHGCVPSPRKDGTPMKVVQEPPIRFRCDSCGAQNEGRPDEFRQMNTMPPTWRAACAFCHATTTCSPSPLIARLVGGGVSGAL